MTLAHVYALAGNCMPYLVLFLVVLHHNAIIRYKNN